MVHPTNGLRIPQTPLAGGVRGRALQPEGARSGLGRIWETSELKFLEKRIHPSAVRPKHYQQLLDFDWLQLQDFLPMWSRQTRTAGKFSLEGEIGAHQEGC